MGTSDDSHHPREIPPFPLSQKGGRGEVVAPRPGMSVPMSCGSMESPPLPDPRRGAYWANGATLTLAAPRAAPRIVLVDTPGWLRYTRGACINDDRRFEPLVQALV
jgi:hypothetical protein